MVKFLGSRWNIIFDPQGGGLFGQEAPIDVLFFCLAILQCARDQESLACGGGVRSYTSKKHVLKYSRSRPPSGWRPPRRGQWPTEWHPPAVPGPDRGVPLCLLCATMWLDRVVQDKIPRVERRWKSRIIIKKEKSSGHGSKLWKFRNLEFAEIAKCHKKSENEGRRQKKGKRRAGPGRGVAPGPGRVHQPDGNGHERWGANWRTGIRSLGCLLRHLPPSSKSLLCNNPNIKSSSSTEE